MKMKKIILFNVIAVAVALSACGNQASEKQKTEEAPQVVQRNVASELPPPDSAGNITDKGFKNGDVLFQVSTGPLMLPLQSATASRWTHCGVVWTKKNGDVIVVEANSGVEMTPINDWIASGENGKYLHMRIKNGSGSLTKEQEDAMFNRMKSMKGKPYDTKYMWSDEKYYCSELVWKVYQAAGIELCSPKKIKEYELGSAEVIAAMEKKWGSKIPMEEPAVSPGLIADSPLLVKINEN